MKHREPVSKIMSKQLITVSVNQSLQEVDAIFDTRNIRQVLVTSGDELVGMLSKTDLAQRMLMMQVVAD
jgi:CBS domain-containing protein